MNKVLFEEISHNSIHYHDSIYQQNDRIFLFLVVLSMRFLCVLYNSHDRNTNNERDSSNQKGRNSKLALILHNTVIFTNQHTRCTSSL